MATKLGNLLQKTVNQAGIAEQVDAAMVCQECDQVVAELFGKGFQEKAKALYIKNGTVTIAVTSPVIGQELKMREAEIMEKVQKKAGKLEVKKLRFLV